MGDIGLELEDVSNCNSKCLEKFSAAGISKPGAVERHSASGDPDLRRVIDAWSKLPESVRRAIVILVTG